MNLEGHIQTKVPLMVKVFSLSTTSLTSRGNQPIRRAGQWDTEAEPSRFLTGLTSWVEALKCWRRCPEVGMRAQGWKGAA